MSKNPLEIVLLTYNHRTLKFLLTVQKDRYYLIKPEDHEGLLSANNLSEFAINYLLSKFGINASKVTALETRIDGDRSAVCLLLSTLDSGNPDLISRLMTKWVDLPDLAKSKASEELRRLIEDSVSTFDRSKVEIDIHAINSRAISFLEQEAVVEDDSYGWPHYLGQQSIGSIGTAIGVLCLVHAKTQSPIVFRGIDTVRSMQNADGGWPVKSLIGESARSITESTLYALWSMLEAGYGPDDQCIIKAVSWLEHCQKQSGGWGSTPDAKRDRVFPTSFAIRLLVKIIPNSSVVKSGVSWLKSARNLDGGWSVFSHESGYSGPSTPLHTAHALLALLAAGVSAEDDLVKSGIEWLLANYSNNVEEGWESQSEVESVSANTLLDYRHYSTPWCILALIRSGVPLWHQEIVNACKRLVVKQHAQGYWTNKLLPGQIPIWATHDCLLLLNEVANVLSSRLELVAQTADLEQETKVLEKAFLEQIKKSAKAPRSNAATKWIVLWNLVITLVLLGFVLSNPSYIAAIGSNPIVSPALTVLTTILGLFAVGFAPFVYQLLIEEYKLRRGVNVGLKKT